MNPQISIIVPMYNAERFICRCMESILSQSFHDYEIVAVDDGSTDDTGRILDEYAKDHSKIKAIHTKNKGVSHARNTALEKADDEYITFVDVDDYLERDFLSSMLSREADLIIGGFNKIGEGEETTSPESAFYTPKTYKECFDKYLFTDLLKAPWGKIFKRIIIEEFHIRFNEELIFAEDVVFVQTYIVHCKSIRCNNFTGYYYCLVSSPTKYLLNEDQCMKLSASLQKSYNSICETYNYDNHIYKYYNVPHTIIYLFYTTQCVGYAFSFKGWNKYNRFIKTFNKQFVIEKRLDLYTIILYLFKHNETVISFLLLRIVRPFFHNIETEWRYWKYLSY